MNDAPRDDLQAEDFRMTAHLLRELQVLRQRGNEDALFAVVRHRSGELVGLNELSWSRSQPTHVSRVHLVRLGWGRPHDEWCQKE